MKEDVEKIFISDKWNAWTEKSKDISFKSTIKYIGNGEEKLAKELDILTSLGGQNNIFDLHNEILGNISVKDITKDDCVLGTKGCQNMRSIFRKTIYPLICWCENYHTICKYAENIYNQLNKSYGNSKFTLFDGIERTELSKTNFSKLNSIFEDIKKKSNDRAQKKQNIKSLQSEYIVDICKYLQESSLQEKMTECVRQEAIDMTLIIVHEIKGWMIVKDLNKISCPRITRGSPRININYG